MAEYPIIMKQKNNQGDYDTLYPQTLGSQIQGNIQSSQVEGNIPSSQISGTFPASQITGLPTSLPADGGNADTVDNQTVAQIIEAAVSQGVQIETGTYVGTGTYGADNPNSLIFGFVPKVVFIAGNLDSSFPFVYPNTTTYVRTGSGSNLSNVQVSWETNLMSWYATSNSHYQLNFLNTTYNYIAIG